MKKKTNQWNKFLKKKMKKKYKRKMKIKRIWQKQKRKFRKYLQIHLANDYRRIILQIRLLETKMQELRLEEKYVH